MTFPRRNFLGFLAALPAAMTLAPRASAQPANEGEIRITRGLLAENVWLESRIGVNTDAFALADPGFPAAGDTLRVAGGVSTWREIQAGPDGSFDCPAGAALVVRVPSAEARVMMLRASGHSHVTINGVPRAGDPTGLGFVRLPVPLRAGDNQFVFYGMSGRVSASLIPSRAPLTIEPDDVTVPDLVLNESGDLICGVLVVNASEQWADGLVIQARTADRQVERPTELPRIPPLSVRKCRVVLPRPAVARARELAFDLFLRRGRFSPGPPIDTTRIGVRVRREEEVYLRAFVSQIDDSVQLYAVRPPADPPDSGADLATVFSLHGEALPALEHAARFSEREWAYIICPYGRRPYFRAGPSAWDDPLALTPPVARYAWSDVAREDAIEVVSDTQLIFRQDPSRIYLHGQGVGAHGAWQLATTNPDRFAALGVSGGWFDDVPPAPGPGLDGLLRRVPSSVNTAAILSNVRDLGVYVLHGEADEQVPVTHALLAERALTTFHHDFTVQIRPGTAHLWDVSEESGDDAVDWSPMFDLFSRRTLPPIESRRVSVFTTLDPSLAARCRFATIHAQTRPMEHSSVDLRVDVVNRRIAGTTSNVALLALEPPRNEGPRLRVELDGRDVEVPDRGRIFLRRDSGGWSGVSALPDQAKNSLRIGPFPELFRRKFVLVYGTAGTPGQSDACLAKARFDAEAFWVRFNGAPEIVADATFNSSDYRDRNVVLYGNDTINSAWVSMLPDAPVRVIDGAVAVGNRNFESDRLAAFFVRPRPGASRSLVGAVAWTGDAGLRAIASLPSFSLNLPDFTLLSADVLRDGPAAVIGAGFFGSDWSIGGGEFFWRPEP